MSKEPCELLVAFSNLLPRQGCGLDIACGEGQNSFFLARCGLKVIGVDRSRKALVQGRQYSLQSNLTVAFVQADLTHFQIPANNFCAIVCFKYREPSLYPILRAALMPGGLFIYHTYTSEHRRFGMKPQNPAHLLNPGEMLRAFGDWQIIYYREEWKSQGMASLVARKPKA